MPGTSIEAAVWLPMNIRAAKGLTLIELMTTVLVAALVLGIGVPAFTDFIASNRMATAVNDITSTIHMPN